MRKTSYFKLLCLALVGMASGAQAVIVDINARSHDLNNPTGIFLEAGDYTVRNVGTSDGGLYDSWSNWSSTTCGTVTGCELTSPTTDTGFRSAYHVISDDLTNVSVDGMTLDLLSEIPAFPGLFEDYFASTGSTTRYHVDDRLVYPDALTALAAARTSSFTLAASGFVEFAINDRPLGDNRGGVSLEILAASMPPEPPVTPVPAPGSLALALLGLIAISRSKLRPRSR